MSFLTIDRESTIRNLQDQFNALFQYLKIEFFSEAHAVGKLNARSKMIAANKRIGDIQHLSNIGLYEINADQPVSKFESDLEKEYGLYVQVFRKSGSIWLETSATDSWTLNQQNEEGRSLQEHFKTEIEDPDAHDIY